jgi:hypothetical protein
MDWLFPFQLILFAKTNQILIIIQNLDNERLKNKIMNYKEKRDVYQNHTIKYIVTL